MNDFLILALIAGIGLASIAGPLGCVVIWKRVAFFGDTLAHASLMGAAIGLLMDLNLFMSILAVCGLIVFLLPWSEKNQQLALDTGMSILSQGFLALGIILLSKVKSRFDLNAYLFGDILTIIPYEIFLIYAGGILILGCLWKIWPSLLSLTIASELAFVEKINIKKINYIYSMLLAVFIALSIKIVGILLITSLLVLPSSIAQFWAKSPEQMVVLASIIGIFMVGIGLFCANFWDFPAGPSIVLSGFSFFIVVRFFYILKFNIK